MATSPTLSKAAASTILHDRTAKEYCDLELIIPGEKTISVHKVVVCPQSSVLAAAQVHDASDSPYTINFDGETTERVVEYLYTGEYTLGRSPIYVGFSDYDEISSLTLSAHCQVVSLALQLKISALASKAVNYIEMELRLKGDLLNFLDHIPFVYSISGETGVLLQDVIVKATRRCFGPKFATGGNGRKLLEDAFAQTPAFAKGVLDSCVVIDAHGLKAPDVIYKEYL
ncbi:BTB/POZ fold domain containing protein [Cordyceps militaris CM01]|uniref:BTB/POZ fold domain containing protein n=1 Tax=Cordyceps militaris (strain CM01) TaxID=983644 RepID=G3JED0_CORMM|nr:BTB/POZ fold domain containing protein [Cordyceps militaris CM01]EGX93381.1 BTB/POZ fold domain containing protein [Cordyceps militaris CM01]